MASFIIPLATCHLQNQANQPKCKKTLTTEFMYYSDLIKSKASTDNKKYATTTAFLHVLCLIIILFVSWNEKILWNFLMIKVVVVQNEFKLTDKYISSKCLIILIPQRAFNLKQCSNCYPFIIPPSFCIFRWLSRSQCFDLFKIMYSLNASMLLCVFMLMGGFGGVSFPNI